MSRTRKLTQIINEQVARWEYLRQSANAKRATPRRLQQPVITISSAYGSRGFEIGTMVADSLGFDFYDREIVTKITASARVRKALVESVDDRVKGAFEEYVTDLFETGHFTSGDYLKHLSKVVLTLGHHGKAVIVGRGAHHILDPKWTLRARTTAPLQERIKLVAELEQISPKEARAAVLAKDAERGAYCRLHFNQDIADPQTYDLVIKTTDLGPQQSAQIIENAFRIRLAAQKPQHT